MSSIKNDLARFFQQIAADKDLPREVVRKAMEDALALAYRHTHKGVTVKRVALNDERGDMRVWLTKDNDSEEEVVVSMAELGRIGAYAVRNHFEQMLRYAEADYLADSMKAKVGWLAQGVVQPYNREHRVTLVRVDKVDAILPAREQVPGERYYPNRVITVLIKEVRVVDRLLQVIVSRSCSEFVQATLRQEVPEIASGEIEVVSIARDPGVRTKVVVRSLAPNVNAVAACIGTRGSRVQQINRLLGLNESIDIVPWSDDLVKFVTAALGIEGPAKITAVEEKRLRVALPERQVSLAIGRGGSNAHLAGTVVGYELDLIAAEENAA